MENERIFNFINPKSNDTLSNLNGNDLLELLYYLEIYLLGYRKTLNLSGRDTFGFELEVEKCNIKTIDDKLDKMKLSDTWKLKDDRSLSEGAEINSPILKDNTISWNELKKICQMLEENAIIGIHSGGHIHIGAQVLGNQIESWLNLIKLWSAYENIIYRFSYGDLLNARFSIKKFAYPTAILLQRDYEYIKNIKKEVELIDIIHILSGRRVQGINFNNVSTKDPSITEYKNTIEFRCPNGTLDPIIWQNNLCLNSISK